MISPHSAEHTLYRVVHYGKMTRGDSVNKKLPEIKVAGDSLLIHAFAYSLLVGVYLVISDMTGYSHSCHSIKLIHCDAPQRDVLSDKMAL